MKLSFKGQSYESASHTIETIPSGITGKFLGQAYQLRRPLDPCTPQKLGLNSRKYRGVAY